MAEEFAQELVSVVQVPKTVPLDLVYPQKQYGFEWGISAEREREILAAWKLKMETK